MKSKLKFIFAFIITFCIGSFCLAGCGEQPPQDRQIEFYSNGQVVQTINISELMQMSLSDIVLPQAERGYEFDEFVSGNGLVLNQGNLEQFALDQTDTQINITWRPITYAVVWDMNGIGEMPTTSSYTINSNIYVPNPEVEGYYFYGWTYEGCEYPVYDIVLGDGYNIGNITYYANWELRQDVPYTIETYYENEYVDDSYYLYDSQQMYGVYNQYAVYDAPNISYYTLVEDLSVLTGQIKLDEPLVLKAYYKSNRITLTFDYDNGTEPDVFVARQGKTFNRFNTSPTKVGYTLNSWKSSSGISYDTYQLRYVNQVKNETYTAVWVPNYNTKYVVKVFAEQLDGSYKLNETETNYATTDSLVSIDLKYVENLYSPYGDYYFDSDSSITSGNVNGNGSTELVLYFKLNTYTVNFELNGGKLAQNNTSPLTQTVKSGTVITPPKVEKQGYTFSNWKNSNGSAVFNWQIRKADTYTASWTPGNVKVTINIYKETVSNGYELYKNVTLNQKVDQETYYTYPSLTNATRLEYTNYDLDKTYSQQQNAEATIGSNSVTYTPKADGSLIVNLYYNLKTKTITFKYGYVHEGSTQKVYTFKYGQEVPNDIYPTGLEREHYTHDGWDATIISPILDNQVINAVWVANQYKITYDLGEGVSNSANNLEVYTIKNANSVVLDAFKRGYNFIGWTIDDSDEKLIQFKYSQLGYKDVTLHAHFELAVYTITYNGVEGAENNNPTTYTIYDNIKINRPVKYGYVFDGWTRGISKYLDCEIALGTTGDITLTANWYEYELNPITLVFGNDVNNYIKDIDLENVSVEFFGAKCYGNDGNPVEVTMEKLYETQGVDGGRYRVKFTATNQGKTVTKETNFIVVPKPVITFGQTMFVLNDIKTEYYDYLKIALEVTVSGRNPSITYYFSKDEVKLDGPPQIGGVYTLTVIAHDDADYRVEENQIIKVYEPDSITYQLDESITEVRADHIIEDLNIIAYDAAGDLIPLKNISFNVYVSAGYEGPIKLNLHDPFNYYKVISTHSVKVYGTPNITFKYPWGTDYVRETESLESLFIVQDSFGKDLERTVTTDVEYKAQNFVTFTCSATDHLGNTNTVTASKLVSSENFGYKYGFYNEEKVIMISKYLGTSENVIIPDGTLYIDSYIFDDEIAGSIKKIVVPNSVLVISWFAFDNAVNLEELYLPFVGPIGCETIDKSFATQIMDIGTIFTNDGEPTKLKKLVITRDFKPFATDIRYSTWDGIVEISTVLGSVAKRAEEVIIDVATPENFDVTVLGDLLTNNSTIKNLVLPEFVTDLPEIKNCSSLQTVTPSTNLTSISIVNCKLFQSEISFAQSVSQVPANAFEGCSSLSNVTLHEGIVTIGDSAFKNCTSLTNITLPSNLGSIGASAFEGSGLTNITFPITLLSIGDNAFKNCASLKRADLPYNEVVVGKSAFAYTGLTQINAPALSTVSAGTYTGCSAIEKVILDGNIGTVTAKYLERIKNQSIPLLVVSKGITAIERQAFLYTRATTVEFASDSTMTKISDTAFAEMSTLKNVILAPSITQIGSYSFEMCYALETINLENVTEISYGAFSKCSALSNFTLSNSLQIIQSNAFENCKMPENLVLPDSVTEIGSLKLKLNRLPCQAILQF